jgi:hypothetical protein
MTGSLVKVRLPLVLLYLLLALLRLLQTFPFHPLLLYLPPHPRLPMAALCLWPLLQMPHPLCPGLPHLLRSCMLTPPLLRPLRLHQPFLVHLQEHLDLQHLQRPRPSPSHLLLPLPHLKAPRFTRAHLELLHPLPLPHFQVLLRILVRTSSS